MGVQSLAARLRTILLGDEEFAIVLRGAGLALAIRVIAGAIGFSSLILLARWMGYAEYGY
jgi:O-antigen/teichoic acid export membrane protein